MFPKIIPRVALLRSALPAILIVLVLSPVAMPVRAQENVRDLLRMAGMEEQLAGVLPALRQQIERLPLPKPEMRAAFIDAAEACFAPEPMFDALVAKLQPRVSDVDLASFREFYATPLGQTLLDTDRPVPSEADPRAAERAGERILVSLAAEDPERLRLYQRLLDSSGYVDDMVAISLNIGSAVYQGMRSAMRDKMILPEDAFREKLRQAEPRVRAQVGKAILAELAYAYRDLTMDDLREIAVSADRPEAVRFRIAFTEALGAVLETQARGFGEGVVALLAERKL
jgi:hypothetical protein